MAMVIGSLCSCPVSPLSHAHCESALDSGALARLLVTVVCGGNSGQNFFQKHTGGDLWRLKILECTMVIKEGLHI